MSEKTGTNLIYRPRRKVRSGKYLCWIGAILCALVVGIIFFFIISVVLSVRQRPHSVHYQKPLPNSQPDSVVQPLIDGQQTFDIAVTVWVRATEEEEEEDRRGHLQDWRELSLSEERNINDQDVFSQKFGWFTVGTELLKNEDILETPLYSDIAFRGLRLSDKGISTTINFRLPTARFLGVNLTSSDLRASFVLIPSSPSLIDYLKNYSSWIPDSIKLLPRRPWPFPLGSLEESNRTMTDEALDSFGISIPLIEFQDIQSRCSGKGHGEQASPVHKRHPHVITRTQLRIVDETNIFNRIAYDKQHKALKRSHCGSSYLFWGSRYCSRDYLVNGHWETRLQLEMPIPGNESETEVQWAYPPYLSTLKYGAGPLDLLAVPVSCEDYLISSNDTVAMLLPKPADEEFMDITWRISFSGRSPGKMIFTDMFDVPVRVNSNATQYEKVMSHDVAELINGIQGHMFHDDAHPRRRIFVLILHFACWILLAIFDLHYWYTLISTVSISIFGTALLALDLVLEAVAAIAYPTNAPGEGDKYLMLSLLYQTTMIIKAISMIMTITRANLGWWKGTTWIPIVRRAVATHKERASMRLDMQLSWRARGSLFLSLIGIYYFLTPHHNLIIPSSLPCVECPNWKLRDLIFIFNTSLTITGRISQLLLNHRSRTFAGQYKLAVVLNITLWALYFADFIPAVLGRIDARGGVSVHGVGFMVLWMVTGWQMMILPSVTQAVGEDEDEE